MKSLTDIGGNIRKYRELKNFTQEYVADELGISRVQYGSLEQGKNDITITRLYNIAKILGTTIDHILEIEKKEVYIANNNNALNKVNDISVVNKLIELYEEKIKNLEAKIKS